jgi:arylsulfatase A-like enzyme
MLRKALMPYDGEWRVPTIWRIPDSKRRKGHTEALFSTVDLMPTLLGLAGVAVPDRVQGVSQRSVLEGREKSVRSAVYAEFDNKEEHNARIRYIRTDSWMLAYFFNLEFGLMYDMATDPDQQKNLFFDPVHNATKNELIRELLDQTTAADPWLPPKRCHA